VTRELIYGRCWHGLPIPYHHRVRSSSQTGYRETRWTRTSEGRIALITLSSADQLMQSPVLVRYPKRGMNQRILSVCVLALFCRVSIVQSEDLKARRVSEYPAPTVREEQHIVIDGVTETWRLLWNAAPKPYCGANESDTSLTCPCMGFAYGESGDLYLVRLRNGTEIDRLHLTPLFEEGEEAVVQRWPKDEERDYKLADHKDFSNLVSRRPTVQVMHLDDYDHDGKPTEFYLQTEAVPCGKSVGVVVGLSTSNARLHVFGTASNPSNPLYLQRREWQALRDASSGPVNIVDWSCGDHGADTQTEIQLQWSAKGIDGKRREYTCPSNNENRRFMNERPL
jgi:hypothetical protein